MTDWELWAYAHQVLSQHRERASEFIAERIGAMVLADNLAGMRVWKEIARRAADLMTSSGRAARFIEQETTVHTPATIALFGADGHVRKLDDILREAIDLALVLNNGNVDAAARQLGIGRSTLYRRFKVGKRKGR